MNSQSVSANAVMAGQGRVTTKIETDPLLTIPQLAEMLGVSLNHVYAMRARGDGPKAVKLSHKIVRFRLSDVNVWLKERESKCTAEDA